MQPFDYDEALEEVLKKDNRYDQGAYHFVREALDYTQVVIARKTGDKEPRHITGQELLGGIRDHALETFGPMVLTVLNEWGVHRCEDFGEIVFNLVENHLLAKTDQDNRSDFENGYDFEEVFQKPFLPKSASTKKQPSRKAEKN